MRLLLSQDEFEHVLEDGSSLSIETGRDYFLLAVKKVAPEVLDDLAGEPFNLYKAAGLAFDGEATRHYWNHPQWNRFEDHEIDYDLNLAALQKGIFDWSKRYNLDAAWCRERAFETLAWWHTNYGFRNNRIWAEFSSMQQTIVPDRNGLYFQFSVKSLYPSVGTRNAEVKRLTAHFERELTTFLDARERIAEENGMKRPKQKHHKRLHFEWLARWQLDESLTHERIAEQDTRQQSLTVQAVSKAIKQVANLIGLPLRKSKRRPRPTF